MLLAEIHGHILREAEGNEDYLTSTVFGHLRYLLPGVFWEEFFRLAKALPIAGEEKSLSEYLAERGCRISEFSTLEIHFWPSHPKFGQPDMLLCFKKEGSHPIVILVEVKLWSEKSGVGKDDQLARYLRILNDLSALNANLPKDPIGALLYLTPRESLEEVHSTLSSCRGEPVNGGLLFRVQWQDVLVAANRALSGADRRSELILRDVSLFLRRRGLEYFNGFAEEPDLRAFGAQEGFFYVSKGSFEGFTEVVGLETIQVEKAGGFMSDDYGKKLTSALAAIRRLHSDTSKLMVDFDAYMFADGWDSVFENVATRDLTYHVKAKFWMAEGVYRYYTKNPKGGLVEGLTVVFFDPRADEPLFLTGQLQYRLEANKLISDACGAWDICRLYFDLIDKRELGRVYRHKNIDNGGIESAKVLAVPLMSIQSLADAQAKLNEIREAQV
jgi:hypothetical protein